MTWNQTIWKIFHYLDLVKNFYSCYNNHKSSDPNVSRKQGTLEAFCDECMLLITIVIVPTLTTNITMSSCCIRVMPGKETTTNAATKYCNPDTEDRHCFLISQT